MTEEVVNSSAEQPKEEVESLEDKAKAFMELSGQQKADYVNPLLAKNLSLEQIAKEEFGKSRSWLSKLLNADGFHNPNGKGYKQVASNRKQRKSKDSTELPKGLLELLEHKDALLALVAGEKAPVDATMPDIRILDEYKEETLVPRSFKLPKKLSDAFDELGATTRISKQDLCTLAIAYFVQQYKNS